MWFEWHVAISLLSFGSFFSMTEKILLTTITTIITNSYSIYNITTYSSSQWKLNNYIVLLKYYCWSKNIELSCFSWNCIYSFQIGYKANAFYLAIKFKRIVHIAVVRHWSFPIIDVFSYGRCQIQNLSIWSWRCVAVD